MVGVIWTIQWVHYPLMADVGEATFPAYHRRHMQRITHVVAPVMLVELGSGLWLFGLAAASVERAPGVGGSFGLLSSSLALLMVAWFSTVVVQVPQHRRLRSGYDRPSIRRLVIGNWIRTVAWTARAALLLVGAMPQ